MSTYMFELCFAAERLDTIVEVVYYTRMLDADYARRWHMLDRVVVEAAADIRHGHCCARLAGAMLSCS